MYLSKAATSHVLYLRICLMIFLICSSVGLAFARVLKRMEDDYKEKIVKMGQKIDELNKKLKG